MNVLLLRDKEDAFDKYHDAFERDGYQVCSIPVLESEYSHLEELKMFADKIDNYSGLIFTSKRAINAFKKAVNEIKIQEIAANENIQIYVVGRSSEIVLKKLGLKSIGSETGNANQLSEFIISKEMNTKKPLMFLCGNLAREIIPKQLTNAKIPNESISCYRTIPNVKLVANLNSYLLKTRPNIIIFFSPSGAEFYLSAIKQAIQEFDKIKIVCIGQYTAEAVTKLKQRVDGVAVKPTPDSLLQVVKTLNFDIAGEELSSLTIRTKSEST